MDFDIFCEKMRSSFRKNGIEELFSQSGAEKLHKMTGELASVGANMNLTAIKDECEMISKHITDSAFAIPHICGKKILDVGAGAGFPSFVIAALTDCDVLSLDSTAKKTAYINNTAKVSGISNILGISGRAEELSQKEEYREKFDTVTARAVANLPVLCELCLPFVKVGGRFVALKGQSGKVELERAAKAIALLGGRVTEDKEISLICDDETAARHIIVIEKIANTPAKYPRKYAKITASPIQ